MDKCPYCERKFKQITDFPIVKVISAGIYDEGQIANEIHAKHSDFWTMGEMVNLGTEIDCLKKSSDALKKFSKTLEGAVGKETRVEELLPDWVFSANKIPGTENYIIAIAEAESRKESRVTDIVLFKQRGHIPTYKEFLKIGEIAYEGLINH